MGCQLSNDVRYFLKEFFPCGNFPRVFSEVATSQVYPSRSTWPPPFVLAAARGSLTHPGKMQISLKLNNENSNEIPANLNTKLLVLYLLRS